MLKWVLILLNWPLFVYMVWMILQDGFTRQPFALSVLEMLIICLAVLLLYFSATFPVTKVTGWLSAVLRCGVFIMLALPSLFFIYVLNA